MIFLNLSLDKIVISYDGNDFVLDHKNIEKTFPKFLNDIYISNPFREIFVLNGPGSFTALRVGTLCLNLLNMFLKKKGDMVNIFSISKVELYTYLYKIGFLPNIGICFIGQRNKVWKLDLDRGTHEFVQVDSLIDDFFGIDFFVDELTDSFMSRIGTDSIGNILSFGTHENALSIKFGDKIDYIDFNKIISENGLISDFEITPNYMIDPSIN